MSNSSNWFQKLSNQVYTLSAVVFLAIVATYGAYSFMGSQSGPVLVYGDSVGTVVLTKDKCELLEQVAPKFKDQVFAAKVTLNDPADQADQKTPACWTDGKNVDAQFADNYFIFNGQGGYAFLAKDGFHAQ